MNMGVNQVGCSHNEGFYRVSQEVWKTLVRQRGRAFRWGNRTGTTRHAMCVQIPSLSACPSHPFCMYNLKLGYNPQKSVTVPTFSLCEALTASSGIFSLAQLFFTTISHSSSSFPLRFHCPFFSSSLCPTHLSSFAHPITIWWVLVGCLWGKPHRRRTSTGSPWAWL